jgi:hypothetical protein
MAHAEHRTFTTRTRSARSIRAGWSWWRSGEVVGRLVLEPGWRWSEHVKPLAGTEWCEAPHFQHRAAGTLRIRMTDGTELDAGPGELTALPAGHDAWVVGDEEAVMIDWHGASTYAQG